MQVIEKAKKKPSMSDTMMMLVVALIFCALSGILTMQGVNMWNVVFSLAFIGGGYILILFMALLWLAAMKILSGKATFYDGLTALTYGCFVMASGMLLAALISFVFSIAGMRGLFLGQILNFFIFVFSLIYAQVIMLKTAAYLYDVDFITVLIAHVIIQFSLIVALYGSMIQGLSMIGFGPWGRGMMQKGFFWNQGPWSMMQNWDGKKYDWRFNMLNGGGMMQWYKNANDTSVNGQ
ncbi:MAG: hypothetical protein HY453_01135 [Parcubacteria group bacterium]|nr:hypothetical protein [Parcubacteria group bacterium]